MTDYLLLGRYPDTQIDLQLAGDPSMILAITHLAGAQVTIGDTVTAGQTVLGAVRGFPAQLDQPLRQFTTDDGDRARDGRRTGAHATLGGPEASRAVDHAERQRSARRKTTRLGLCDKLTGTREPPSRIARLHVPVRAGRRP